MGVVSYVRCLVNDQSEYYANWDKLQLTYYLRPIAFEKADKE